ncbi:MAG: hypothetical protein IT452_09485 [Planctomycetia bacterium]|nr:hypothetical protein [Planctomycetia bacterium]
MDAHSGSESPGLPVEKPSQLPSVVALVLLSAATLAALFIYGSRRGHQRRDTAKSQLKQLGVYVALYESTYKAYPPDATSFSRMLREVGTDERALFECPECKGRLDVLWQVAPSGRWAPPGGTPYTWTEAGITGAAPPDLPIAWHLCRREHGDPDFPVLCFQGRVDVFAPPPPGQKLPAGFTPPSRK